MMNRRRFTDYFPIVNTCDQSIGQYANVNAVQEELPRWGAAPR